MLSSATKFDKVYKHLQSPKPVIKMLETYLVSITQFLDHQTLYHRMYQDIPVMHCVKASGIYISTVAAASNLNSH